MANTAEVTLPAVSSSQPLHQSQTQQPSPPASQPSHHNSSSPTASPTFPTKLRSQSTAKSIHTADICYPESFLRTPISLLQVPHPKWHARPSTGEIYEGTTPIIEEHDLETGYMDSVGEIMESIECCSGGVGSVGSGGQEGGEEGRPWRGYVEYEESGERWSLRREGLVPELGLRKRGLDGEEGIEQAFRKKVKAGN